jgi:hypothetical protein
VLLGIGGCVALLSLVVVVRQRKVGQRNRVGRASDGRASATGAAMQLTRRTAVPAGAVPAVEPPAPRPAGSFARRIMPERRGPYPTIASPLQIRLRAAAGKGERIPALARRHGLSLDAVRAALGTTAGSAPAARSGSSFRSTPPTLPPKPRAKPVAGRRNPYEAMA